MTLFENPIQRNVTIAFALAAAVLGGSVLLNQDENTLQEMEQRVQKLSILDID